jgi:hypothetical protein
MFVEGINAHVTYSLIAIVGNSGELIHKPVPHLGTLGR